MALQKNTCVLIDANFLVAWIDQKISEENKLKIEYFLQEVEKTKSKIIIPMPAIAEYLVGADIAGADTIKKLEKKAHIRLEPFDLKAAFECSLLDRGAKNTGDKKDGSQSAWQKIKIDRQIVAIGKAHGATVVISSDEDVRNNSIRCGIDAIQIEDLELPEQSKQIPLTLDSKS